MIIFSKLKHWIVLNVCSDVCLAFSCRMYLDIAGLSDPISVPNCLQFSSSKHGHGMSSFGNGGVELHLSNVRLNAICCYAYRASFSFTEIRKIRAMLCERRHCIGCWKLFCSNWNTNCSTVAWINGCLCPVWRSTLLKEDLLFECRSNFIHIEYCPDARSQGW